MFAFPTDTRMDSLYRQYFTLALLISLLFSPLAFAKKKQELQVVVTDTYISMHTGPGRGYPIFHVLEKGEVITLLYSKTDWIKAETEKGLKGWVHRRSMDDTVGVNGESVELGIPQLGDFSNRSWEVGVSAGEFDNVESLGVHAAYRLTKNISAELRYSQATGSFSNSKIVSWGIVHQPFPEWKISPFFTLANGQIDISPNNNLSQAQDQDDNFYLIGTGLYYYLSHRFMVRFEYNNYTTLPDRNNNENVDEWRLGISAFF